MQNTMLIPRTDRHVPHTLEILGLLMLCNEHIWWRLTDIEWKSVNIIVSIYFTVVYYKYIFLFLAVLTNYLSVRVQGEPVLKYNTAVLRCQVPQSAASYTKIISWTRGSTRLYPSTRGGNMTLIGLFCGLCAAFF